MMISFVVVMNADLYGRSIETQVARGVGTVEASEAMPTVRLVLHRLPADENAVECSILIDAGSDLTKLIRNGKSGVTATIRDGSSFHPYGIGHSVTLDGTTASLRAGVFVSAVESERFFLPAFPSVGGFPFDDLKIRPIVDVVKDDGYTGHFRLEVQKSLPSRLLDVSEENIPTITLTRSPTEKAIVVTSALVFLFLSSILAFGLYAARRGLTTLEELLAVGGYLVAAAGFRELLGVSRSSGTSALEVAIIGIPMLLLASGVAVSFVRGRIHSESKRENQTEDSS